MLFDREKRQEETRIKKLRELLGRLEPPEFWDRLSKSQASPTDEPDSFQQAIARRAHALGVTPQKLLSDYAQQLRESTYPTADCLGAEEAQAIVASGDPNAKQAAHLQVCRSCRQLLSASQLDAPAMEELLSKIQRARAEASTAAEEASPSHLKTAIAYFVDH